MEKGVVMAEWGVEEGDEQKQEEKEGEVIVGKEEEQEKEKGMVMVIYGVEKDDEQDNEGGGKCNGREEGRVGIGNKNTSKGNEAEEK